MYTTSEQIGDEFVSKQIQRALKAEQPRLSNLAQFVWKLHNVYIQTLCHF